MPRNHPHRWTRAVELRGQSGEVEEQLEIAHQVDLSGTAGSRLSQLAAGYHDYGCWPASRARANHFIKDDLVGTTDNPPSPGV
jgi:hypothetical protein